jgi:hypothetical protein
LVKNEIFKECVPGRGRGSQKKELNKIGNLERIVLLQGG